MKTVEYFELPRKCLGEFTLVMPAGAELLTLDLSHVPLLYALVDSRQTETEQRRFLCVLCREKIDPKLGLRYIGSLHPQGFGAIHIFEVGR